MKTFIHFWWYLAQFFLEWEMFQTKVVEKIKTHILCPVTFFRKSCRLWDNLEKKITGALHEDLYTILIISRSVLLRMRNVSDKAVEKLKTHILCSVTFFRKSCRLWDNLETMTGTLHEDLYTILIICRSVLLRMRNVSDKSCRENQNTHFVFSNFSSQIVPFMR